MQPATRTAARRPWHLYVPKLVSVLRRGYGFDDFRHDLVAGLTVAVVALPLAMALTSTYRLRRTRSCAAFGSARFTWSANILTLR